MKLEPHSVARVDLDAVDPRRLATLSTRLTPRAWQRRIAARVSLAYVGLPEMTPPAKRK